MGQSLGVRVSPVLQLSLCRGAESERSCFPLLAASGTDWVGIPLLPRAPSRSCLRGSVKEKAPCLRLSVHSGSGRADRSCGSAQHGQAFAGLGHCSHECGTHPTPTLLETRRLSGFGVQARERATGQAATGFFFPEYAPLNASSGNCMQLDSPPTAKGEEPARRREPLVTDSCVGPESGVLWNGMSVGWEAHSGKLDPRPTGLW